MRLLVTQHEAASANGRAVPACVYLAVSQRCHIVMPVQLTCICRQDVGHAGKSNANAKGRKRGASRVS